MNLLHLQLKWNAVKCRVYTVFTIANAITEKPLFHVCKISCRLLQTKKHPGSWWNNPENFSWRSMCQDLKHIPMWVQPVIWARALRRTPPIRPRRPSPWFVWIIWDCANWIRCQAKIPLHWHLRRWCHQPWTCTIMVSIIGYETSIKNRLKYRMHVLWRQIPRLNRTWLRTSLIQRNQFGGHAIHNFMCMMCLCMTASSWCHFAKTQPRNDLRSDVPRLNRTWLRTCRIQKIIRWTCNP